MKNNKTSKPIIKNSESNLIKSLDKFLFLIIAVISLFLIFLHFISNILGFYFTGDTISSMETALSGRPGNLLAVFQSYYSVWPPAMGFFYSILRILPISFISQHHVYVLLVFVMTLGIGYLIVSKLTKSRLLRIIILSLVLFGGVQEFLFHTAMSEPLFIFFWLSVIYCTERFFTTSKERYLLLFIMAASGMTLSRYSGLSILFSLLAVIFVFVFYTYKQKKYSPSLVFVASVFVWIPIGMYLLKNKMLDNLFFGLHDVQFADVTLVDIVQNLTPTLFQNVTLLVLISLFVGMRIGWNKNVKYIFILAGFSSLTYIFFLYYGFLSYRFQNGFQSRLLGISYPELVLGSLGLGSLIAYKFPKVQRFAILGLFIGVIYLGYQTNIVVSRLIQEPSTDRSVVLGTEYSQDIKSLCRGKTPNKFLLIQESSRNWTAQSLKFYCQPIEIVDIKSLPKKLPHNSLIYSAYPVEQPSLILDKLYEGEKKVYLYKTTQEIELKKTGNLNNLQILE